MRWMDDEAGSALVEMALFLPLYILVLGGIANCGFLIVEDIQVQEAAAAGAAFATIPGNYSNTNGMQTAAKASSSMLGSLITTVAVNVYSCSSGGTAVNTTASCPGGGGPLMFAQVTTTYTATTVLNFAGFPSTVTMQGFASYEVPPAS